MAVLGFAVLNLSVFSMASPVDKSSPVPRYFQLVNSLKQRIAAGEFAEGAPLPPERQLTTEYDVSRITVVKAMDELKKAGMVESQHGRGTFVKSQAVIDQARQTPHQYFFQHGDKHQWKVLERSWLSSPPAVVEAFALSGNELQLRVTLLLSIAKEPTAIFMAHIPRRIAMGQQLEALSDARLLAVIKANQLVTDKHPQQSIEAIAANKMAATWLQISTGKPLLAMDSLYLDASNHIEQYSRTLFRGDRCRYQC